MSHSMSIRRCTLANHSMTGDLSSVFLWLARLVPKYKHSPRPSYHPPARTTKASRRRKHLNRQRSRSQARKELYAMERIKESRLHLADGAPRRFESNASRPRHRPRHRPLLFHSSSRNRRR